MNNQKYNLMLKAIGMCIGIERLHSHMGAIPLGTWMLAQGAKIENVSRMMGHTNITQTQRYAKVQGQRRCMTTMTWWRKRWRKRIKSNSPSSRRAITPIII